MDALDRIYFPFALQLHGKIYENDEVSPHIVWRLRDYMVEAAQETLTAISNNEIKDTI